MLRHASLADIPADIQARINSRLDEVAVAEGVRIFFAVESGSRAWGFASPDSDFDIRFIYVRRVDDYLGLVPPRDVIEPTELDKLDVSGWDLRKALLLGLSWNPALVEWLTSPIVYREAGWETAALRRLFVQPMSRDALIQHYFGLGQRQWGRFIDGRNAVKLKKYFYVVRPAVALLWLDLRPEETPPMSLPALVEGVAMPSDVISAIGELRDLKARTNEVGEGARIPVLDLFIQRRLSWAQKNLAGAKKVVDHRLGAAATAIFRASVSGQPMPPLTI